MNTDEALRRLTEVIRRNHLVLVTARSYMAWLSRYYHNRKRFAFHFPN